MAAKKKNYDCVRCGLCCKIGPCGFGKMAPNSRSCKYLEGEGPGKYFCGIHDEIVAHEEYCAELHMFGTGCGPSLFNFEREKVLWDLKI